MNDGHVAPGAEKVRLAAALGRSLGVMSRDLAKVFLISAAAHLPLPIISFLGAASPEEIGALDPSGPSVLVYITGRSPIASLAYRVALFALPMVVQATTVDGAMQGMTARRFDLGASLKRGLTRLLPVAGLVLVVGGAIALCEGLLTVVVLFTIGVSRNAGALPPVPDLAHLILVGGIFLLLVLVVAAFFFARWFVALPACILERTGPLRSLRRSTLLTRRNRWRLFGVYLLFLLAGVVGSGAAQAAAIRSAGPIAAGVVGYLLVSLVVSLEAVLVAVVYRDLRRAKEGVDIGRVAAIFE